MESKFYKQRKNKLVAGVVSGLADKYGWDLPLARVLAALLIYFTRFGVVIYILLAIFLPYKEDLLEERYGRGPRRRKDADVLNDEDEGWFW
ncbi:PspC domain-containing protein [Streptococcus equi]|uniref:PspC domain-containing protein n=1 Tax=Streptococcus equi subsp. ruminatorum TaxID=254358 RepID=A0A6M1L3X7_9STRE|nr:PspC domain-containing protein [Streptococcus equi]MCD3443659.1 PspC domain-containing protein [Streptococcus equi subsp. zooepidemicus]NGL84808.1 PspC domain-containing protein [Streptococcus equi subsp. ruminatorum]HEL0614608.1 PspC domain-containing protein [Streptococcus equi subsp. zooepidemicus]HEL1223489.1 PspC domain-containing protein [Streptococcus equi subsp. zooepidemicus]HEL1230119.1 PspC domain-containing protein [Streptococcus equi subsp. zooepidemicus]